MLAALSVVVRLVAEDAIAEVDGSACVPLARAVGDVVGAPAPCVEASAVAVTSVLSALGPAVIWRLAAMARGIGSFALVRRVMDGVSATFTCDFGVKFGWFSARLSVAVAEVSGFGAVSAAFRAMAVSLGLADVGSSAAFRSAGFASVA